MVGSLLWLAQTLGFRYLRLRARSCAWAACIFTTLAGRSFGHLCVSFLWSSP